LQSPYPGLVCIPVANQEEAWLSNFLLDSFDFIPSYSFPLRKNIFNILFEIELDLDWSCSESAFFCQPSALMSE
jgi:hypothetical protein